MIQALSYPVVIIIGIALIIHTIGVAGLAGIGVGFCQRSLLMIIAE
jgi:hypothetical protein